MQRQSYRNVYGKPIVKYVRYLPNLTGKGVVPMIPSQARPPLQFTRDLKITETPPSMGEQRYVAKQRIGKGLRML